MPPKRPKNHSIVVFAPQPKTKDIVSPTLAWALGLSTFFSASAVIAGGSAVSLLSVMVADRRCGLASRSSTASRIVNVFFVGLQVDSVVLFLLFFVAWLSMMFNVMMFYLVLPSMTDSLVRWRYDRVRLFVLYGHEKKMILEQNLKLERLKMRESSERTHDDWLK